MNPNRHSHATRTRGVGGTVAAILLGLIVLLHDKNPFIWLSYDWVSIFAPGRDQDDVTIVYMDDASAKALGLDPGEAWPRKFHVRLIRRLSDLGAKATVFDLLFSDEKDPVADAQLVEAAKSNGHVFVGSKTTFGTDQGTVGNTDVEMPFPALCKVAEVGFAIGGADTNTADREILTGTEQNPSLPWLVAEKILGRPPADERVNLWLNYYGPRESLRHLSFADVLEGNPMMEPTLSGWISNKVIFVGTKSSDSFRTPHTFVTGTRTAGVEINATAYLNLVRGEWLNRTKPLTELLVVSICGLLMGVTIARLRLLPSIVTSGVCILLTFACALFFLTQRGLWFPWIIVAGLQIPLALGWTLLRNWGIKSRRDEPLALLADVANGSASGSSKVHATSEQANAANSIPDLLVPNEEPIRQENRIAHPARATVPAVPDHTLILCFARGSYGEVWLAKTAIGTYVAVKVVYRSAFSTSIPYEREFGGLQRFAPISRSHPGLVNVLHVGRNEKENYFYSIMELGDDEEREQDIVPEAYKKKTLASLIQSRRKLPVSDCIEIGLQLSSALEFLHGRNLIHRDIKPSNIIFVNGVAKFADVGLVTEITSTQGKVSYLGTEGYIAPEGPGTAAADLFGLGKVLYEASTGKDRLQFPDLPTTLFETPDQLAARFNAIILKTCELQAELRLQSAAELHRQLVALRLTDSDGPLGR